MYVYTIILFSYVAQEAYKAEYVYISWLARCYVMNGNPRSAWSAISPIFQSVSLHDDVCM
jgi:hypothetical protein